DRHGAQELLTGHFFGHKFDADLRQRSTVEHHPTLDRGQRRRPAVATSNSEHQRQTADDSCGRHHGRSTIGSVTPGTPLRVLRAESMRTGVRSTTKRTEPSARHTLAPPECPEPIEVNLSSMWG